MQRILFVCSQNKLRSPTAEQVFAEYPGIEVASAGTNHDAEVPVGPELLQWADLIFAMEQVHRNKLSKKFKMYLGNKKIICLNIPDHYEYMDPELVQILRSRVTRWLKQ